MAKRSKQVPVKDGFAAGLPAWMSSNWFFGLVLLLAVVVVYQPIWYAGFIWDDDLFTSVNPCIVGPLGLKELWTTAAADICPLTLTTFWFEYAWWPLQPLPYHLVNILWHGASALVLWRVLLALHVPGAWIGAALWAVHPVQVESVAWIAEMKNTQSGFFYLLTILFYIKWLRAQEAAMKKGVGGYGLALIFAALAMMSKSSTVILPMVLGLCAWWVGKEWRWRYVTSLVPFFLMSLAASVVSVWTQKLNGSVDMQNAPGWPTRLAMAGDVPWFYLGKLLWPHPLLAVYPPWEINTVNASAYLPLLASVLVLGVLWLKRGTWARPWFFAYGYFLIALLPVLGLVYSTFFRYSLVADHFQYLASIGPLALAGAGVVRLSDWIPNGKPWLLPTLTCGFMSIFGLLSWWQGWYYENEETLWSHTLAWNPKCWVAYNELGVISNKRGELDVAMGDYQKTLELNPNYAEARYNMGNAFLHQKRMDEAIDQYQRALAINPRYVDAYTNLGSALLMAGRPDEAMAQYEKALEISPRHVAARYDLGFILFKKGKLDEAIFEYQKALEIDPNNATYHNGLGRAFAEKARWDEAAVQFQEALRLEPGLTAAQNNLTQAEAEMRQTAAPR